MARLNKTTRRRILRAIPPLRCSARTTEGDPCEKWATVGATVCGTHGAAAPQVRAAADRRVLLAETLVSGPRRQPWQVMEDVAHTADALYRDARLEVESGTFTQASLEKLVAALERAHRLSNVNVQTGLAERRQRFAEAQASQMHRVFTAVLARLDLTAAQRKLVPAALKAEIAPLLAIEGQVADR